MPHDAVSVERRDRVAIVRLDRKGRANALSFAIMDALAEAARGFETDTDLAAVILTGADDVFSAGMDLRDPAFARLDDMALAELRALAGLGPRMARAWAGIEAPTVAAIEGPCLGGGLALAAMCDFRVAGPDARFGAPEVAVGVNMGWHSVPRLTALVGAQATRRLLLIGEEWTAEDALRLGFADRIADEGAALDAALAMAATLAARPATATRMVKRQIDAAAHGLDLMASATDMDQHALTWLSEDFRAALKRFGKRGG
ncbi:enoyl-CoA hydratase/isomerase family protein [Microbaculum marinisediminis]|uniref:Enoyl-CoA hydratase/isomerase family protein n=1 Tax=Microbaculum marinisediminis TaxID=2931392 RepID=A0AAW5R005_9HYPH|nr:enoyl-CoA hydratase/isomerase family protein [Microbaculum sp. A6E488]MCT8972522.1 enoyl-CoA hydratase/isomerase family protein [Microbaculum sp. A6E488]